MAASIYSIPDWSINTNYSKNDIYKYNNLYYYAISNHNSGSVFDINFSNGIIMYNGSNKPYFFFTPSYNSNTDIKPSVKEVKFGDGFTQRSPDGINNVLLGFNLTFDKRTDAETRAILHFLTTRAGHQSFVFVAPF